ncbi:DUF4245 domain-containing protein [Nocardiopsis sp. RSe5-2]|uniref:DUF4245 domain-containing protein n=1 Tax=Nocardiopsis endophytica TaxID=3018445 RepID=A0ABT4U3V3_9ACTN|nr:DUF4245 domain-containing protein [Nocardiopsis endophytica]MDA2810987.1 DUF4245 domain-containing protein [Nocardiopsis endophytica]
MSTYNRSQATMGPMVLAMAILVGVLLLMAMVVKWRTVEHIPSVDYAPQAEAMEREADFPVYAPEGLPEGWVPTSTNMGADGGTTWTVGFATPSDMHAEYLITGDAEAAEAAAGGAAEGTVEAGGLEWERRGADSDGDRALVHEGEDGGFLVVSGSADEEELERLAASLQER